MENKDIDKAAREYAEKQYPNANPNDAPYHTTGDSWDDCYDAFLAGAQSRQPEIDELREALEEATRWIPVSEELPHPNTPILIYRPEHVVVSGFYGYNADGSQAFMTYNVRGNLENVTDWRYIDTPKAAQLLEKYGKKAESVKPKE